MRQATPYVSSCPYWTRLDLKSCRRPSTGSVHLRSAKRYRQWRSSLSRLAGRLSRRDVTTPVSLYSWHAADIHQISLPVAQYLTLLTRPMHVLYHGGQPAPADVMDNQPGILVANILRFDGALLSRDVEGWTIVLHGCDRRTHLRFVFGRQPADERAPTWSRSSGPAPWATMIAPISVPQEWRGDTPSRAA